MKTLLMGCLLLCLQGQAGMDSLTPQSQGGITYISGGVGIDEGDALRAVRDQYNLHLLFAVDGKGEYVSDVTVRIADESDRTLLETLSSGPHLFLRVQPGRYRITAAYGGLTMRKTVTVGAGRGAYVSLYWPRSAGA